MDQLISTYLAPVAHWFVGLFTPAEWSAIPWVFIGVLAGTELMKRAHRWKTKNYHNNNWIWGFSLITGTAAAWYKWPGESPMPWFVAGPMLGVLGNWAWGVFIRWLANRNPQLAAALTGDKRIARVGGYTGPDRRAG